MTPKGKKILIISSIIFVVLAIGIIIFFVIRSRNKKKKEEENKKKEGGNSGDTSLINNSDISSGSSGGSGGGSSSIFTFPFKSVQDGNLFRGWVNDKYPAYAKDIDLGRTGELNSYVQRAWEKYGAEYTDKILSQGEKWQLYQTSSGSSSTANKPKKLYKIKTVAPVKTYEDWENVKSTNVIQYPANTTIGFLFFRKPNSDSDEDSTIEKTEDSQRNIIKAKKLLNAPTKYYLKYYNPLKKVPNYLDIGSDISVSGLKKIFIVEQVNA